MNKNQVVFREYVKDIFPYFNGNGAVLHTVSVISKCPKNTIIRHSFGKDECLNEFVRLGPIAEAERLLLEDRKCKKNAEYLFSIYRRYADNRNVVYKDVPNVKNEKRFNVLWNRSFGLSKTAKYTWGWLNNVMFSTFPEDDGQHSLLKVEYPINKLVFRIHLPDMYPIDGMPVVFTSFNNTKYIEVSSLKEAEPDKEAVPFEYFYSRSVPIAKTFEAVVNNPIQGNTYKIVWKIGFENMSKYLSWLESRI